MIKKIISFILIIAALILFKSINDKYEYKYSLNINNQNIELITFDNEITRANGLSGINSSEFSNEEIAIFVFPEEKEVNFWMPNTFFNITIVFLDSDFLVVGKESLEHFKEKANKNNIKLIPKTQKYKAKYVLELKETSRLNNYITIGEYLDINKI